ncbi:thioredoxin domain-containing protein [Arsenophonus sp. PmNCSU2021_1]|uniref:thioredoxin domain-containing protein n=1 Tax=Arsenophonus sp. PmNCSU2021_1 TaxID=3118989 RepID=UPI002FEFEB73
MKSRITVGLLMSALLLPAAVLAETKRCTPKHTDGEIIIELADCKVLSAEEIQKSAIENLSTNFGGMHPVINAKGSVTLVAVYDYACAECKKMAPRLLTLAKNHPDIRVIFRNTQGESPNAQLAAQAEKKVWILQGEKAFMHYFSQLFKGQGQSVKEAMFGVGIAFAGTKEELLGWDVTSDKIARQTKDFLEELNIKTTPAFIVTATNNPDVNTTTMLTGVVDEKTVLAAVQKAKRGA